MCVAVNLVWLLHFDSPSANKVENGNKDGLSAATSFETLFKRAWSRSD